MAPWLEKGLIAAWRCLLLCNWEQVSLGQASISQYLQLIILRFTFTILTITLKLHQHAAKHEGWMENKQEYSSQVLTPIWGTPVCQVWSSPVPLTSAFKNAIGTCMGFWSFGPLLKELRSPPLSPGPEGNLPCIYSISKGSLTDHTSSPVALRILQDNTQCWNSAGLHVGCIPESEEELWKNDPWSGPTRPESETLPRILTIGVALKCSQVITRSTQGWAPLGMLLFLPRLWESWRRTWFPQLCLTNGILNNLPLNETEYIYLSDNFHFRQATSGMEGWAAICDLIFPTGHFNTWCPTSRLKEVQGRSEPFLPILPPAYGWGASKSGAEMKAGRGSGSHHLLGCPSETSPEAQLRLNFRWTTNNYLVSLCPVRYSGILVLKLYSLFIWNAT